MKTKELVEAMAQTLNMPKKKVKKVLDCATETIIEKTTAGDKVSVGKLGTFFLKEYPEKTKTNPETGENKTIPARTIPNFKAGKEYKAKLQ